MILIPDLYLGVLSAFWRGVGEGWVGGVEMEGGLGGGGGGVKGVKFSYANLTPELNIGRAALCYSGSCSESVVIYIDYSARLRHMYNDKRLLAGFKDDAGEVRLLRWLIQAE